MTAAAYDATKFLPACLMIANVMPDVRQPGQITGSSGQRNAFGSAS
jgi:hypothetical protein